MKTRYLISIIIAFVLMPFAVSAQIYEKQVCEVTYVFDIKARTVENKDNKQTKDGSNKDAPTDVGQPTPLHDIFKKVFSEERVAEFKQYGNPMMFLRLICDTSGKVEEVVFSFWPEILLTPEEFYQLEQLMKSYHFNLQGIPEGAQYVGIRWGLPLARVYMK